MDFKANNLNNQIKVETKRGTLIAEPILNEYFPGIKISYCSSKDEKTREEICYIEHDCIEDKIRAVLYEIEDELDEPLTVVPLEK